MQGMSASPKWQRRVQAVAIASAFGATMLAFANTALAVEATITPTPVATSENEVTPVPTTGLERVRATATIRLGYVDGAKPFSYQDDGGKPAGYSVELCQHVATALKTELALPDLKVEWIEQSFDQRLTAVQDGNVDVQCAAGAATLVDREQVSFSIPVFPGSVGVVLRKDAPSRLKDLLEDGEPRFQPIWRASPAQVLGEKTFAAVPGGAAESFLNERKASLRLASKVVPVADFAAGVEAVILHKADAFFADRALLLDAAQNHPAGHDLVVLDRKFTHQPVALGVPRDDEGLRLVVDRTLSRMYRSGELQKTYEAYFGQADDSTLTFFRLSVLPE